MKRHLESAQTVSISYYGQGSTDELYTFEARNGSRLEMVKVATKQLIARLLNNGYRGSLLRFEGVDTRTKKFFIQCAALR